MPQPKKILLPVDVTHPHPEFLPLLNELVPLKEAQVLLLYVKEELPAMEHILRTLAHTPEEFDRLHSEQADKVLTEIKNKLEAFGAVVKTELVAGPAAAMIEAVARDEGYAITAITPGSPSSVEKFMLGRVSSRVVRHVPGMVLLLRGALPQKIENVIVGLDGSDQSLEAMRGAVSLFGLNDRNVKITLVNVISVTKLMTMISPIEYLSAIESNLRMAGDTLLAEGEKVLAQMGIKNVEMKLVEGQIAEQLIEVAAEIKPSLIVVGSQGRGAVEHFLVGSTSSRLASHAESPVAIFKGPRGKNA
jgi:nucleotide-binding universal stress UspA family protein